LLALGEETQRAWADLLHTVHTGETAFDHAFGMSVWEHRRRYPEHGRMFDAAMAALMTHAAEAFVAACPVAHVKRLVDVGGGDGTLLIALLRAHPELQGVLYDLADVAEQGRKRIIDAGLASRCTAIAGDALDRVPEGADCYLLARVIHDWDDERASTILRNCRRAMAPQGKLLVFERVVPAYGPPSAAARAAALTDVTMMVSTGGRERTESEYAALLAAAGLTPSVVIPTRSGLSIIECRVDGRLAAAFSPAGA
jgi:ubiquinone/menaquinone biosynthesis C-methylase UbiE